MLQTRDVVFNVVVIGAIDNLLRQFVIEFVFGFDDCSPEPNINHLQRPRVQFPEDTHGVSIHARQQGAQIRAEKENIVDIIRRYNRSEEFFRFDCRLFVAYCLQACCRLFANYLLISTGQFLIHILAFSVIFI